MVRGIQVDGETSDCSSVAEGFDVRFLGVLEYGS
jgi:hypothetical protein